MSRSDAGPRRFDSAPAEDDLGPLIRWSMERSLGDAQPPDRVWQTVSERVRKMQPPVARSRRAGRLWLPVAPLVQTAVISALLLAFGLGVERNASTTPSRTVARSTPIVRTVASQPREEDDILRGYMLWRRETVQLAVPRGYIRDVEVHR